MIYQVMILAMYIWDICDSTLSFSPIGVTCPGRGSWVISHDLTPDLSSVWEGGKFVWVIWFCANEVGPTIK